MLKDLDVIIEFDNEDMRDAFMLSAVSNEDLNINDELLQYSGEKSVLLASEQAAELSSLADRFGGVAGSADSKPPSISVSPRTYQEMVKSWDSLMIDIKNRNRLSR